MQMDPPALVAPTIPSEAACDVVPVACGRGGHGHGHERHARLAGVAPMAGDPRAEGRGAQ